MNGSIVRIPTNAFAGLRPVPQSRDAEARLASRNRRVSHARSARRPLDYPAATALPSLTIARTSIPGHCRGLVGTPHSSRDRRDRRFVAFEFGGITVISAVGVWMLRRAWLRAQPRSA